MQVPPFHYCAIKAFCDVIKYIARLKPGMEGAAVRNCPIPCAFRKIPDPYGTKYLCWATPESFFFPKLWDLQSHYCQHSVLLLVGAPIRGKYKMAFSGRCRCWFWAAIQVSWYVWQWGGLLKYLINWKTYRWLVCFWVNFDDFPHTISLWSMMCRNRNTFAVKENSLKCVRMKRPGKWQNINLE